MFESFGDYKSGIFIYSTIPFITFFGLNEFSVRITAVAYGILAVLSVYLLSKELFNKQIGLISAFLLAISPWHIHLSRIGFELISSVFWIPISFYFLLKSTKNKIFIPFTLLGFAISFYTYSTPKLYLPLLVLFFFIIYHEKIYILIRNKTFWKWFLFTIPVFLLSPFFIC